MLVRLSDSSFVDDLHEYFLRFGFSAERAGGSMVQVGRPDAASRDEEQRDVELHVSLWGATNPDVQADLVG
jgi:hypothetical protein